MNEIEKKWCADILADMGHSFKGDELLLEFETVVDALIAHSYTAKNVTVHELVEASRPSERHESTLKLRDADTGSAKRLCQELGAISRGGTPNASPKNNSGDGSLPSSPKSQRSSSKKTSRALIQHRENPYR